MSLMALMTVMSLIALMTVMFLVVLTTLTPDVSNIPDGPLTTVMSLIALPTVMSEMALYTSCDFRNAHDVIHASETLLTKE